jgi:protein-disulfide isomerase
MTARSTALVLLLALASAGSTCRPSNGIGPDKDPPDVNIPGIDTSSFTLREKREYNGYMATLPAPCSDVAVPLGQCVLEKRACARCFPAAKFVAKSVRDGLSHDQLDEAYRKRFDAAQIKSLSLAGSPSRGPENAPVVVVEFADFECPFCQLMAPFIDAMAEKHKADVRVVYKFLPLQMHSHGDPAARAGIAAQMQGKFWEMHHLLFVNHAHLEPQDLESYAKEIGLDVARFRADMASQVATDRIAQDQRLADDLKVSGTPSIYINGREFDIHADLEEWVSTELAVATGTALPAATVPSASAPLAAPSSSSAPK